jgi:hypothetical protein
MSPTPRTISINTVQGIGDIFWVYQKLAPYFDTINLNILCVDTGIIQTRARAFCKMLPKVGAVTYQKVDGRTYNRVAQTRFAMSDVLHRAPGPLDYAVNSPLETGVNLRDVDPEYPIEEFVDMGLPATVERGDYLCVFVSGTNRTPSVWTPAQWGVAIRQVAFAMTPTPSRIIFVGAAWDQQIATEVATRLPDFLTVTGFVGGLSLEGSMEIIRGSRLFLGYQSGLNVIAENYNVKQLMVYFDKLLLMRNTWCKPESIRTRFWAITFATEPRSIVGEVFDHFMHA